jgi:parallel beta-helix repeat protein
MGGDYISQGYKNEFRGWTDSAETGLLRHERYPARNSDCARLDFSDKSYKKSIGCRSSPKSTIRRSFTLFIFLLTFLIYPHRAFSSGIGLVNFNGDVTITNSSFSNNFTGIMGTVTNAASTQNIWIYSNTITASQRHGIKFDFSDTSGVISIRNNSLDNFNAFDNGRFGIRIRNAPSPYIDGNTIQNFGRSGIQFQSITNITVINNYLHSNGSSDYSTVVNGETLHNAAGLQALYSTFRNVADNIITSNLHAGIAAYGTGGTIGPNNVIKYDGNPQLQGSGAGLQDCAAIAGGPGSYRGGILAIPSPIIIIMM